ncbi:DNA gyrase subunit A [Proteocatella sphenisci]|uniref:DNA gyrase subunit A n=1 Tax=Proteocatella sphenisci TaxID=181070 RepID=UPI00048C0A8A|nr:DNA gyrase subunit A [Proteocatella sphenisci]
METNQFDKTIDIDIKDEMEKSYIDYSMSVIVGRALPDVRDGLKPVHRRILFSMSEQGLTPEKPYRKSATVVGDVLGKYHPHGDSAVYEAMVKMAQKFSIRYPLVDGQGNFGSIDGDSAAAMRYTEAKMTKMAVEMLKDLDKDTVDFMPNFDERIKEPRVLPSRYPNLLVNGSNGIAVGMATSIPPHNLSEVIDAVVELIDNEDASVEDLMKHVKGPDFPTGAMIYGKTLMNQAYRTGRGKVTQRAKAEIEEMSNGKSQIIVTEIPYQVNKSKLVEKIADLVKEKRVEGITDLRDESNRKGIRIVIETKKDVNAHVLLNNLYKYSQLQQTYSIIMLAIVDGEPKVLSLDQMLRHYLDHQEEVVTRRTKFELNKALNRAHIIEGLLIAIDNIDEVIAIIRSAYEDAQERLIKRFELTEIQAQAIMDMRLRRLQGLEKEKLEEEFKVLNERITYFKGVLADRNLLLGIVKTEILEVKEKYGDARRTEILDQEDDIEDIDMIDDEEVAITLTHFGYVKRVPVDTYKSQKRGGKGIASMTTREEDFAEKMLVTSNHAKIVFLTNMGRMYRIPAYKIPQSSRTAKGTNIVNLIPIEKDEKINSIIAVKGSADNENLVMCTKNGIIKKTELALFRKSQRNGLIAITLKEDDELISARITKGDERIIVTTREGKAIAFEESQIRQTGRNTMGVKAMNISKTDNIISMEVVEEDKCLLVITENGYGKRTGIEEYKIQTRGGKGVKTYNVSSQTGQISGARLVGEEDQIMIINSDGTMIRMEVKQIPKLSRVTKGVKLMKSLDSKIVSFERIEASEELEGIEIEETQE